MEDALTVAINSRQTQRVHLGAYAVKLSALLEREAKRRCSSAEQPLSRGAAPSPLIEPLSERELEMLRLVADGLSNREIADALILARGTVKAHLHNVYGKLAVQGRTQAVIRAQELRLV